MNWYKALVQIHKFINVGLKLDPTVQYKIVVAIPPYTCRRNGFAGTNGFKVQVGRNDFVEIPITMLEKLFYTSINNQGRNYNKKTFQYNYPNLYNQKPCFVNSIGGLLVAAGVAVQIGRSDYKII